MLEDRVPALSDAGSSLKQNIPAAISDIGCEREINEDRYAVIDSPTGRAWVVCDGMGGTLGGDLAAQLAIDAIRRGLEARVFSNPTEAIKSAIEEANRVIVLRRQNPAFSNMGTTVVAAMVNNDEVVIAHSGDSRAYLVRDGSIEQLTVDHTYVQDLVDRGTITQEEAMSHPDAHVLTRCIGYNPRLDLETQSFWIWDILPDRQEDILILCSDGLYSLVSDEEIAEQINSSSPQEACVKLVETAKSRGGYDNITVAVLPLGGELREESPASRKPTPASIPSHKSATRIRPLDADLPFWKKSMILVFLALLGGALTGLVMLISLVKS